MKRLFAFLVVMSAVTLLFAQVPDKMSYQAVIRNSTDILVTNTQIGMEINIRQGSVSGSVVYTETQTPTTNDNGLVSIEFGGGPGFNTIDWSVGPYFLETKTDLAGGTNYTITGTSQLLSVPYALHAKSADTVVGGITETDPVFGASPSGSIAGSDILNWNNAYAWGDHSAAGYLTSYSETDPLWMAASSGYYTKTQMQTSGQSLLHWDNVTNKPASLADYGAELDPSWAGTNDSTGNIFRTGKVSIGSSDTAALLYTYGDGTGGGNVLFVGSFKGSSGGNTPASGSGTRMMWYPDKAAFRVGEVNGDIWNKDSIGNFSFAAGYTTKAKGSGSIAMGYFSVAYGDFSFATGNNSSATGYNSSAIGYSVTASGDYSTALGSLTMSSGDCSTAMGAMSMSSGDYSMTMGYVTSAYGNYSTALGYYSTASGNASTAMGYYSTASGSYSTAMGYSITALSANEHVFGRYNTSYSPLNVTGWDAADRLFVIGNGAGPSNLSDAMVVLKNGHIGIGISTPARTLHVNSVMRLQPTAIAPASPAEGDMYMNATTHKLMVYDGSIWQACW
ncbi:MAG: hypothetical protein AB7V36_14665 [Bacteroidales bacterium]|nr:hypothetical protein [Bacteroidales bacterium]